MLKKWRDGIDHANGFILINSVVALSLVVMGLVWLGLCEHQLKLQREKMRTTLRVVRLAKEATDQVVTTGQPVDVNAQPFRISARQHSVVVSEGGRVIYEVRS